MAYVLITILLTVLLSVIFRYYETFGVRNLPAIVVNYFVCAAIGSAFAGKWPHQAFVNHEVWVPYAIAISLLFIIAFNVLALTIQHFGIYFTALMQKTALIFTVLFAVFYFGDALVLIKVIGILCALAAIYLITRKNKEKKGDQKWTFYLMMLPLVTFAFSGVIDVLFFFLERTHKVIPGDTHFVSFLFFMAGCFGLAPLLLSLLRGKKGIGRKEILGGIALGIPNFFSIHFYILAMGSMGGALVVPMVSVGTILFAAIFGYFLFREKLSVTNLCGAGLAVIAIVLLSLAST